MPTIHETTFTWDQFSALADELSCVQSELKQADYKIIGLLSELECEFKRTEDLSFELIEAKNKIVALEAKIKAFSTTFDEGAALLEVERVLLHKESFINKLGAIKKYCDLFGCTLQQAKDAVEDRFFYQLPGSDKHSGWLLKAKY